VIVLVTIVIFALFLYSVILHEIAHGWVALKCGDPTAKWEGRLTLNPLPHIDPFMSIIVPALMYFGGGILFGGAKPVPVNVRNLRKYPRDWILVSLAGVATNFLIAATCAGLLHIFAFVAPGLIGNGAFLGEVLFQTAITNLILVVFNLVPIPPLDGSRAFRFLLHGEMRRAYDSIERYGLLVLVIFINLPFCNAIVWNGVHLFERLLGLDRLIA
jgi:Zn-dependent protease